MTTTVQLTPDDVSDLWARIAALDTATVAAPAPATAVQDDGAGRRAAATPPPIITEKRLQKLEKQAARLATRHALRQERATATRVPPRGSIASGDAAACIRTQTAATTDEPHGGLAEKFLAQPSLTDRLLRGRL